LKIKKRYYLKKKKQKKLIEKLADFSKLIGSKSRIEILETDVNDIILVDGDPLIMMMDDIPFPTLKGALELEFTSKFVVVDMGAVKFVAKGADVMCPGIVNADKNIKEGDLVIVVDELHEKPLATGRSLITGEEMIKRKEGKAIKTIHHIGDKIWNLEV